MNTKDQSFINAKKAYSNLSIFDLEGNSLPPIFELLTTKQRQLFVDFFDSAQDNFQEEYDTALEEEFLDEVRDRLGSNGYNEVKNIMYHMQLKVCK